MSELQRNATWLNARIGKVTASKFNVVNKKPRAKRDVEAGLITDGQMTYLLQLINDVLLSVPGEAYEDSDVASLKWGVELEDEAIMKFEQQAGVEVVESGFVPYTGTNKELVGLVGVSPDGLVGEDAIIEVKCPYNSVHHLRTLVTNSVPGHYMAQVQGNMWVTGRKKAYFISYDPRYDDLGLGLKVVEVPFDQDFIAELEENLVRFVRFYKKTFEELVGVDVMTFLETRNKSIVGEEK